MSTGRGPNGDIKVLEDVSEENFDVRSKNDFTTVDGDIWFDESFQHDWMLFERFKFKSVRHSMHESPVKI